MPPAPTSAAPAERADMGRISGVLWIVASAVAAAVTFLPGAQHVGTGWVLALAAATGLYGLLSVTGAIPWDRATIGELAVGTVVTIPVVGLAVYLTGGSLSYVEPLLVCTLLYAAFFFPARWAWPLAIELILIAGTPLLYDDRAIANAYLPRYLALAAGYLTATWVMVGLKRRLVDAEAYQREMANRDPLTGIGNRRAFDTVLQRELDLRTRPRGSRRAGDPGPLALMIIDLDDFKGVNDRHGHQVGDAVLREAAERTASMLRANDSLARIGGDEFAVIAPGAHGEGAGRLAEAIKAEIGRRDPGSAALTPRASIGWAVFPDDGLDFESLLRTADERMLRRKSGGRRLELRS